MSRSVLLSVSAPATITLLIAMGVASCLLAGCSKPVPPTGKYVAHVGELRFKTTTSAYVFLIGGSKYSGVHNDASYTRSGNTLVVTTKPRQDPRVAGDSYINTYTFDILKDGAEMRLVKMSALDVKTHQAEVKDAPDNIDFLYSKKLDDEYDD